MKPAANAAVLDTFPLRKQQIDCVGQSCEVACIVDWNFARSRTAYGPPSEVLPSDRGQEDQPVSTILGDVSAHDIVETVRSALLVLDDDLCVRSANRSFYRMFGVTPDETIGRTVYDLGNGHLNIPTLRRQLETVIPAKKVIEAFEIEQDI
jgi:PAS domain-containing protein